MLAPYRALLGLPGAPRLVASSTLGRIPIGMASLAILLFVKDVTGSFAAAGAVTAAELVAVSLGTPVQGRIIDRVGQPPVLITCAVVHLSAFVALVALGLADAPLWTLMGAALVAGAFVPPLSPAQRTLWPVLVERGGADRRMVDTAYAFEAVSIEVLFVIGPLVAAVLLAVASPAAAIIVAGLLAMAGSLLFATSEPSRTWRPRAAEAPHWLGPLRARAVLVLLAVAVPNGLAVGLIEMGIPAYAEGEGTRAAAGGLIAAWAIGSLAGGLYYGSRGFRGTPARRLIALHLALAVTALPLAAAPGLAPMAVLCLIAGLPLASSGACLNALLADVAPPGTETEANTWLISAIVGGLALGGVLAGVLAEGPGPEAGFAGGALAFLVACGVAVAGRRILAADAAVRPGSPVRSAA